MRDRDSSFGIISSHRKSGDPIHLLIVDDFVSNCFDVLCEDVVCADDWR
jgi:hypothetical protein